ncbi:MAG: glycosyltransferase family 39 protein [Roseovarius sp.]|nr:glycosyltransferase family 39 protein [Roseovarius sp.]
MTVAVLAALCAIPLMKGTMLLDEPYGDSHDGRNGAVWASSAEALRAGPMTSRWGAVWLDGTTYANHPPAIQTVVATAELVGGNHSRSHRTAMLISLWLALVLLYALLRELRFSVPTALLGVGSLAVTPFVRIYGTMVDTPILGLPIAICTLLGLVRLERRRTVDAWLLGLLVLGPLVSWQMVFLDALVLVAVLVRKDLRGWFRVTAAAFAGGMAALGGWLLWVHGGVGPVLDVFLTRSAASGDLAGGPAEALDLQSAALQVFLGPLFLALGATVIAALRRGDRQVVAAMSIVVVLGYAALTSNGAAIHDYWSYWALLPMALGVALVGEFVVGHLSRWSFGRPTQAIASAALIAAFFVPALVPTTLHERVNGTSAPIGAVLDELEPAPDQETVWVLGGFFLTDRWLTRSPFEFAYLEERDYRRLIRQGRQADIVLIESSCRITDLMACDRVPGRADPYPERTFQIIRVKDLERPHPR